MLPELLPYGLALIAGFLVKWVDWLDDDKKSAHPAKYALAILYGALIGWLISTASFSALFLAAMAGQVFALKVDTAAHRLALAVAILAALAAGFPPLDVPLFLFFVVFAFLDEADYVGKLRPLTEYRLMLKLAALIPIAWGRWDFFVAIIAFDFGYALFEWLQAKRKPKKRR